LYRYFVAFTVKSHELGAEDSEMLYVAFNAHHLPAKVGDVTAVELSVCKPFCV
jgi:hypothetical protein